ncbi:cupin domain protein [bacterium BMS3Bbin08]|nr:cupin domain protein [bacterium BMS3Bbin08]HDH50987.1 cupin domain-containing protein [Nitrospirota bacterium]
MKKPAKKSSRKKTASSCDWRSGHSKTGKTFASPVVKHRGNCTWKGVRTEAYKKGKEDWSGIIRRVLVGEGMNAKSHVRYFEIAPGGSSSFEKHRHEHIVVGIKGKGTVLLDRKRYKIGFLDVVYVSPDTPHQFQNPSDEPFGFICVVSAGRDKPVLLS